MGMRVGSVGGSSAISQIQMAQRVKAPVAAPAPVLKPDASAQDTQIQSVLSMLRGQGGNVDLMA